MTERVWETDVLVVGASLAGVSAALAALRAGARVVLAQDGPWVGGQVTSQLVPPDEHPWIEAFGANSSYRAFRQAVRDHYRRWYPLRERSQALPYLNPGAGRVGPLCHEPKVALAVLEGLLGPWEVAGRLRRLRGTPVAADTDGDRLKAVAFSVFEGHEQVLVEGNGRVSVGRSERVSVEGSERVGPERSTPREPSGVVSSVVQGDERVEPTQSTRRQADGVAFSVAEGTERVGPELSTRRGADGVVFPMVEGSERVWVEAAYFVEATETGELLALAGVEHATGAEAQSDTDEPHAPATARPLDMQAVSWCVALSHHAGENHVIDKPADYEHWRSLAPPFWPGRQFGWTAPHPITLDPMAYAFNPNPDDDPALIVADQSKDPGSADLWTFRRVLARRHFQDGWAASDVTILNWPQIDYLGGPVIGGPETDNQHHRAQAKAQTRAFLYWLQTEAPRPDGGTGYPGLRPRPDVAGTPDGFAHDPYIRESRRLLGLRRVTENDIALAVRGERGATRHEDSVAIGAYRIDLHPSTGGSNYIDVAAWPFQVPLGALIPRRVRNVVAAGKTISTTHISSGCHRLHPIEWGTGEAAGTLAAHALATGHDPHAIAANPALVADLQARLLAAGAELAWPDVRPY